MNSHFLMYKHIRKQTPYESYIKQKIEIEEKKERVKYYDDVLKFRESRYPQELMAQLEQEINPFELSLDKLKEFYNSKFPQYSNELVHEAVEFVFKKKCQQSNMIKESYLIIEAGNQAIRNGRKLQKEDFSYFYQKLDNIKSSELSFSQQNSKDMITDSPKEDSINSKIYQEIQAKTEKFNKLLIEELNREKGKFQNMQIIEEGDPRDFVFYKQPTSRRQNLSESFPKFKEIDLIVKPEGGNDTGRTQLQELNYLLGALTMRGQQEQLGEITGRSRGSSFTVKINKEVMQNLYNARGKLKLDLVRRVVDKIKKDHKTYY